MTREANFTFIPASQLGNHSKVGLIASISLKQHFLSFGLKATDVELLIGKYVKFYVDTQKNTLAWKLFTKEHSFDSLGEYKEIKEVRMGKGDKKIGRQIRIQIPANAWHALKFNTEPKKHQKLEVKTYKPAGFLEDSEFHYIVIEK